MPSAAAIRYLTESDVRASITLDEALELARHGIQADARGQVHGDKFYLPLGEKKFIKPFAGYLEGENYAFVKTFSFFPPVEGETAHRATSSLVLLFEAQTGSPVCLMEADWITGLRTAAATVVTAETLAVPGASRIAIFGAGLQGEMHARAFCHQFALQELTVLDRDNAKAEELAQQLSAELAAPIRPAPILERERVVRRADIIVTVTTGNEPQIRFPWLRPGALVARLGSYQEIGLDVVTNCDKLVVDRWEYVRRRIPELRELADEGRLERPAVYAEWPEIVSGKKPGRESLAEIIVYIALGLWGEYAAILPHVYRRAVESGAGSMIKRGGLP